jgi:hypothetical protein
MYSLMVKTKLEWILAEKVYSYNKNSKVILCMFSFNNLHKFISKFLEIEEIHEQNFLSDEEYEVEQHFK